MGTSRWTARPYFCILVERLLGRGSILGWFDRRGLGTGLGDRDFITSKERYSVIRGGFPMAARVFEDGHPHIAT